MDIVFDLDSQNSIFNDSNFDVKDYNTELYNINTILKRSIEAMMPVLGCYYYDEDGDNTKIDETIVCEDERYYNVPCTRHGIDLGVASACDQIYFEKTSTNIWDSTTGQPDNLSTYLRTELVDTIFIVGINHDGNLKETILGFLKQNFYVVLVMDAIITHNIDINFINTIQKLNVKVTSTKEYLSMLPVIDENDDEWR